MNLEEPEWIFPYQFMETGDSFFMPTLHFSRMFNIIDETSKRVGVPVKCYVVKEDGVLGIRCWRLI